MRYRPLEDPVDSFELETGDRTKQTKFRKMHVHLTKENSHMVMERLEIAAVKSKEATDYMRG